MNMPCLKTIFLWEGQNVPNMIEQERQTHFISSQPRYIRKSNYSSSTKGPKEDPNANASFFKAWFIMYSSLSPICVQCSWAPPQGIIRDHLGFLAALAAYLDTKSDTWDHSDVSGQNIAVQCTMCCLLNRNSSGLLAPGGIFKNHPKKMIERHFFLKLTTRRKIEKIQFPWVPNSKFSIWC